MIKYPEEIRNQSIKAKLHRMKQKLSKFNGLRHVTPLTSKKEANTTHLKGFKMRKTLIYIICLSFIAITAHAGEYLGNFNSNQYDSNGVSNSYGEYGSQYSSKSINNKYGEYGSKYSGKSAHNPYATNPPKAYDSNGNQSTITTNPYQPNAINPHNTKQYNSLTIYSGDK